LAAAGFLAAGAFLAAGFFAAAGFLAAGAERGAERRGKEQKWACGRYEFFSMSAVQRPPRMRATNAPFFGAAGFFALGTTAARGG